MSPDLATLRAHADADGELAPLRRAEVDSTIAADPALAVLSAALFASRLSAGSSAAQGLARPARA